MRKSALLTVLLAFACTPDAPRPRPEVASQPPRALGTLTVEEGEPCGDGDRCIRFVVTCPDVSQPARGYFVIDDPRGPAKGTVASYSFGDGSVLYARSPGDGPLASQRRTFDGLRDEGFRIVQVVWEGGWIWASPGSGESPSQLACRPATATAWIAENLVDPGSPFCTVGGSGGAVQVEYALSHYGLDDRIDLAMPYTGHIVGRLDLGCLDEDPLNASYHFGDPMRAFIDQILGYPQGEGPCSRRDGSVRALLEESSIALGGTDYVHPGTLVYFVLGGADELGALMQGHAHYERLLREGSPLVKVDIVSGAKHGQAGPALIGDVMRRECRPRSG